MPKYETNQRVVGFIRRLPAEFGGFNSQAVTLSGETVQMVHAQFRYDERRIFVAVFTRPGQKHDTMVLSLPLFQIPDQSAASLYGQLLDWNNGATGAVHFAVDEVLNTINLVCVRPVDGITFQEFHHCIASLLATQTQASGRLKQQYSLKDLQTEKR